jgi:hypothetical protein
VTGALLFATSVALTLLAYRPAAPLALATVHATPMEGAA